MTINMKDDSITSVEHLKPLIHAAETLGVEGVKREDGVEDVYAWMSELLLRLTYRKLKKKDKGIIRRYLALYSGYTASHVDHLIARYRKQRKIRRAKRTQPTFKRVYTSEDIVLLAEVAEAYSQQNGKALKRVCAEMYAVHNDERFLRLQHISVSRLYDLKKTEVFKKNTLVYTKTKPTAVNIGERKKPAPEGKPGYIRVDSVHQGDLDKEKGVYHINLVDEVTQHEAVVAVEGISEYFLAPALKEALHSFPFQIINFHSDNGSEYINRTVAKLLKTLAVDQTKSRPRRSNDNGLVEGKNAAVVRKFMGHSHIQKKHAQAINTFYRTHFNPFLCFHRFCAFPDEEIDERGKIVKKYRDYMTPVQKLLSLPNVEHYLKDGITKALLEEEETKQTHLAAAQEMQVAKKKLFKSFST